MDEVPEARPISDSTLESVLRTVTPAWDLREAAPTDRGFCSVYRIEAVGAGTTRELYLKASPDGREWGIPTEARLQAVLEAHTAIPVPPVLGVTDESETLPTPHYLMAALPGESLAYERVGQLGDDALGRLARETGEYLAELHSITTLDGFGGVRHDGPALTGGRPDGDLERLTVRDPFENWSSYLREYVDRELDRHTTSRFSELTPELKRWFSRRIDELEGPFEPVLGRNDHGLHNLLLDPESGEITAMLDWGYTLAVPARFDFEFAVYLYSGAFLAGLPDVRDRRPLVRESMSSGYRTVAPECADVFATTTPLYEATAMLRIMNDFDRLALPDGTETTVRDRIERDARTLLDSNGV